MINSFSIQFEGLNFTTALFEILHDSSTLLLDVFLFTIILILENLTPSRFMKDKTHKKKINSLIILIFLDKSGCSVLALACPRK